MERLDKILAGTGRWSRREVKELIRAGRVQVNGRTAHDPEEKYAREGLELRAMNGVELLITGRISGVDLT